MKVLNSVQTLFSIDVNLRNPLYQYKSLILIVSYYNMLATTTIFYINLFFLVHCLVTFPCNSQLLYIPHIEVHTIIKEVGMNYQTIDACHKDYIIYYG